MMAERVKAPEELLATRHSKAPPAIPANSKAVQKMSVRTEVCSSVLEAARKLFREWSVNPLSPISAKFHPG